MKTALMTLGLLLSAAVLGQVSGAGAQRPAPAAAAAVLPERLFADRHCAACHNDRARAGGFSFSEIDFEHPEKNAEQAEKVILKVSTGLMPPAGRDRPDRAEARAFTAALENKLDSAASAGAAVRPALHRLNRTEYRNAVRDLLGLNVDAEGLLPADSITHGFDNMSEALTVTPTLLEAYVRAAGKIGRLAVGDAGMAPLVETYRVSTNFSQIRHVEGTPFGSRGGIAVVHNFPADAEYVFRLSLVFTRNTLLFGATMEGEQLEVAVNGERVALIDINPLMKTGDNDLRTPPIAIRSGPQTISAAFIRKADGPIEDFLQRPERSLADDFSGQIARLTNPPHLRDLGIMGPYNAAGVSPTPSRNRVFSCVPLAVEEEAACARSILTRLARQAFRGPLDGGQTAEIMAAYEDGRDRGDFEAGIRLGLQFILASPHFVFRFEKPPAGAAPGAEYRLSDLELASRLSFFLWSSLPDEELAGLAEQSKLQDQAVLRQQVRRMLDDPRSASLSQNFAAQWLHLRSLAAANPDSYLYPDSDDNLLQSMRKETELFFASIVHENRDVLDLLTADFTFVDERLAKHYKIPNILGSRFRRITWTDPNRFGLLGQGSVLTATSFSNRTSPVVRGKWVLEQILGVDAPIPPPNIPALEENNVLGGETLKLKTVRERLEQHRSIEPCKSCHAVMDPIGFALEGFDAVGAWRTRDSGFPVDASGKLLDGTAVDSPASLRNALLPYSDAFVRNFTSKLLTFALGRGLSAADMPVVRRIVREAGPSRRFEDIVFGIVTTPSFQRSRAEGASIANN